ncbi:MAG: hypothetical protein KIT25_06450 [Enhydrobacter sp.]|nr:MAG: hypothetical protein KIT25_06450 [Enhydrobacter sp.]
MLIGPNRALLAPPPLRPTWSWNFAAMGRVPPGATFGRASTGWTETAAGLIVPASNNVPRFWRDEGYLAEMQSTNGITRSRTIAAHWSPQNLTAVDDDAVSPDGTQNATTLLEDAADTQKVVASPGVSYVTDGDYGHSIFVKALVGDGWVQLLAAGGTAGVNFQPSTGTIGSTVGGTADRVSGVVARAIGNGWWRLSFSWASNWTGSASARLYLVNSSSAAAGANYLGTGTRKFAVWGGQVDSTGVGVTSYIPTAGSTVTRAQDALSLPVSAIGFDPHQGGVLVARYQLTTHMGSWPGYYQDALYLSDGSINNSVKMVARHWNGINHGGMLHKGGDQKFGLFVAAVPAVYTKRTQAVAWSATRGQIAHDGVLDGTASFSDGLPVGPTTLDIGRYSSHGGNMIVDRVAYYRGAKVDAFGQLVSR